MGGTQGGQPITVRESNEIHTTGGHGTGSGSTTDWNPDQASQLNDVEDHEQPMGSGKRTSTPDANPLQDDEDGVGSTDPAGSEGTTRY